MLKTEQAIDSKLFAVATAGIGEKVKVTNAYMNNKWLCIQLDSNVLLKIKNKSLYAKATI